MAYIFKKPQTIVAVDDENTEFIHQVYADNPNSKFVSFTAQKQGLYQFNLSQDSSAYFMIHTLDDNGKIISQLLDYNVLYILKRTTNIIKFLCFK